MDSVVPEDVPTGPTGAQFGSGRPLDVKLKGSLAKSSDAVASKSTFSSVRTLFIARKHELESIVKNNSSNTTKIN